MKKLFALMLALCLMFSVAMAETTINWEDVAPQLEAIGLTGQFYTFNEIAVAVFIPTGMSPAELPGENYIGYFAADDGSGEALAVMYVDMDGMDLENYAAAIADPSIGATEIEFGTLNGMPCVTYEVPANGTINVAFTTAMGYILEVVVGPLADDNAKIGASYILASVQP